MVVFVAAADASV